MLGYTPPAGQTYAVVRNRYTPSDRHFRTGTFATVTGAYTPLYENDGADVTIPGGTSSFTIEDASVREGGIANFVVKRTSGTGTATVHWELREQGSAAAANADYGYATGNQPQTGDLSFAAGETQKTIAIQTFDDGTPSLTRPSRSTSAIRSPRGSPAPTRPARSSTTTATSRVSRRTCCRTPVRSR